MASGIHARGGIGRRTTCKDGVHRRPHPFGPADKDPQRESDEPTAEDDLQALQGMAPERRTQERLCAEVTEDRQDLRRRREREGRDQPRVRDPMPDDHCQEHAACADAHRHRTPERPPEQQKGLRLAVSAQEAAHQGSRDHQPLTHVHLWSDVRNPNVIVPAKSTAPRYGWKRRAGSPSCRKRAAAVHRQKRSPWAPLHVGEPREGAIRRPATGRAQQAAGRPRP